MRRSIRLIPLAILMIIIAGCLAPLAQPRSPLAQPRSPLAQPRSPRAGVAVYLPIVGGAAVPTATPTPTVAPIPTITPTATPAPIVSCWRTFGAWVFYQLLISDERQAHPNLDCDRRLVAAAERRAMAQPLTGLAHCDQWGVCANVYARAAGCRLPANYGPNSNNIESLLGGTLDPLEAFKGLARSPAHARHLFGDGDFFRAQDRIGIAVVDVPGHRYRWVWVILIGQCEGGESGE